MSDKHGLIGFKDNFNFRCGPDVECFTNCCGDVTIFLTPYDVVRLTEYLEIGSSEFLEKHTQTLRGENPVLPLVTLKMDTDQEKKPCSLVTPEGCTVYPARPWACRMFPLDQISKNEFQLRAASDFCKGLLQENSQTILGYINEQGIDHSALYDTLYQEITNHPGMQSMEVENPAISRMIYMACYDLDKFRAFVLESSFLDKFEIDEERVEAISRDKLELLRLGFDWVKFGLFAEKSLVVKPGQEAKHGPASE